MTNFFIRLYQYFRSHQMVCWLSMVALFVFFGWFATRIYLEEDIDKLMPSSKNEDGTTKLAFADLKIKDKTFLLFESLQGVDSERLSDVCDQFVDTLLVRTDDKGVADTASFHFFYSFEMPSQILQFSNGDQFWYELTPKGMDLYDIKYWKQEEDFSRESLIAQLEKQR